jgi:GGDEF domain-containing protein
MTTSLACRKITARTVDEADHLLSLVMEELQDLARGDQTSGILIARTGPGQFIVGLNEHVPYGIT